MGKGEREAHFHPLWPTPSLPHSHSFESSTKKLGERRNHLILFLSSSIKQEIKESFWKLTFYSLSEGKSESTERPVDPCLNRYYFRTRYIFVSCQTKVIFCFTPSNASPSYLHTVYIKIKIWLRSVIYLLGLRRAI